MKTSKDYNNISPELRKKLTLKPGEIKIFEVLGIRNNGAEKVIPALVKVPSRDTIYDKSKGEFVDIAHLKVAHPDSSGNYRFEPIWFTKRTNGMIACNGSNPRDREAYMFLALSNHNESNPDRGTHARALYREIDIDKEATDKINKEQEIDNVRKWLFEASDASVKILGNKLSLTGYRVVSELKVAIMGIISKSPDAVSKLMTEVDAVGDMPLLIDRAVKSKIIKYDGRKHSWVYSDGGAIKSGVRGASKVEQKQAFASWLNSDEGEKAVKAIKDLLEE